MLYPRKILENLKKWLSEKEIIILNGARQVGKTSILILFFFLLPSSSLRAAKNAIGIRVARNSEHLSPSEWYEKYAPSGDKKNVPSSISFAGYEAVSVGSCASGNGETIYVNATNIDNNNLYTNIYIIACPVGADQDIVDIFNQLIKNWDFNVNNINKSEQGKIQRDTKRLSDIATLNELLANYRASNSRYPELASGTYEVGKSISYWTSWNDVLGAKLKSKLPTPPIGKGWGALTSLEDWKNPAGEKVWPKDMYFPTSVGIDYTSQGCRQITAVKDQKAASWCEGGCKECKALSYSTTDLWSAGTDLVKDLSGYISNLTDELKYPTAIAQGIDYKGYKHILAIKENRWSEFIRDNRGITQTGDQTDSLSNCHTQSAGVYVGSCVDATFGYSFNFPQTGHYVIDVQTANNGATGAGQLSDYNNDKFCSANGIQHHVIISVDGVKKGEFCNDAWPNLNIKTGVVNLGDITAGNHIVTLFWNNDWNKDLDKTWDNGNESDSNIRIYDITIYTIYNFGWTPIAELDTVPETLNIEWSKDIQNPDAVSLAWDKDGQRHIYAFKGNKYREYIDYNRPYVYQTNNQGLSYSLCTYFETAYSSLSGINCSEFQSSNYSPAIAKLTDQKVTIGNYFNYNITAADIDGDNLSWSVDLDDSGTACSVCNIDSAQCLCAWLTFANTSQKNIKKIYGTAPNATETRVITITAKDGRGGTDTKSFKLDVVKSDLVITSFPPADITIGDDYQYDVEAYDPQGYYPLTYSWTPSADFPSGMTKDSINSTTGIIFGTPTNVGLYDVLATVINRNEDNVTQNFRVNVENFSIVNIPDTEMTRDHTIEFFAKTNPEKVKKIKWSIACGSANASCAQDIVYSINELSGEITISTQNTVALYDKFAITVTATSDLNNNIKQEKTFNVMISDAKCGNGTQEGAEQCDDGADGNNTNKCYDDCKFTYCGDGILQKPNGKETISEDCDRENPICCDNASCKWSCSFIPLPDGTNVTYAGPLNFYDKTTKNITDNITVRSGSNNEEMIFPACRIFEAESGKIDAEIIPDVFSTAVVYVTDTSGSMKEEIGDVKSALAEQMDKLYDAANTQKMIDAEKSIFVGLVRFSSNFTFSSIADIQSEINKNNLVNIIETYTASGGTSANPALAKAVEMLDGIVVDKKIIVFLGDGDSTTDPATTTNNAKAAGIEIYGIAYAGGPAAICNWSSDNGVVVDCWSGKYSYLSTDAASVYTTITSKIIAMPAGIINLTINGVLTNFNAPIFPATIVPNISLNLSRITCGDVNKNVPFIAKYTGGGGKIKFYNTRVSICKSCLSTE